MKTLSHTIYILSLLLLFLCSQVLFSQIRTTIDSDPLKILVIAGQSNAINIHANAKELRSALIDTSVRFYYHCGMPPDRNIPFFSTSDNKWTTLAIQRQIPFVANNEYFFGPEITLINGLSSSLKNIAVVKCAYGGSGLADDWNRKATKGNMLYKTMMEQITNACAILDSSGISYSFAGFFWIQGEKDASIQSYAQNYFENLKGLINGVRFDLNSPELPFIITRLPSRQPYNYLALVRNAQEKAAGTIGAVKCIDTDSLGLDRDSIHFISTSVQKLGYLMAGAFLSNITSIKGKNESKLKIQFALEQNYPNPFNPQTTISYSIPEDEYVRLTLYDLLGKEVQLIQNEFKRAGSYIVRFNGNNLPAGLYFYNLRAGKYTATRKFMLVK